ncbi:hypothetical protein DFH29DRAFT_873593 [Suillus ampliporus]|nr:hypothetical protein DFH29DRAFT_873593 [Suillus ampliporus]
MDRPVPAPSGWFPPPAFPRSSIVDYGPNSPSPSLKLEWMIFLVLGPPDHFHLRPDFDPYLLETPDAPEKEAKERAPPPLMGKDFSLGVRRSQADHQFAPDLLATISEDRVQLGGGGRG